jgi:Flp pilus assembly protein CpaB
MRSAPSRRTRSPLKTFTLGVFALLVGAAATIGGLWAAGVELPFLKWGPDVRGMVAVPITTRDIPAYTKVTRDYVLAPNTGAPKYMYLPPAMAKQMGVITDFSQITGRVVDHDKALGYPFTEHDFLPKGTRPGLVAGIPPGKRAITVEVSKIQGIAALRVGDRIDLIASQPVDMQKAMQGRGNALGISSVQVGLMAQTKQANVRVLVQNGALVTPVTTRLVPVFSSSLTQAGVTRTKPVQEAVIAIDPEEIAPLTEALAVEANITCVARSGLPDDPGPASVTPSGPSPSDKIVAVERIIGGNREVMFVPRGTGDPTDTRGMVAVPLCGKPIAAQTRIAPEHLLDPATNRPLLVHLRPGDVRRLGLITDPARIVGRVLNRRKDPDTAFKDEDFLSETTTTVAPKVADVRPLVPSYGTTVGPLRNGRKPR